MAFMRPVQDFDICLQVTRERVREGAKERAKTGLSSSLFIIESTVTFACIAACSLEYLHVSLSLPLSERLTRRLPPIIRHMTMCHHHLHCTCTLTALSINSLHLLFPFTCEHHSLSHPSHTSASTGAQWTHSMDTRCIDGARSIDTSITHHSVLERRFVHPHAQTSRALSNQHHSGQWRWSSLALQLFSLFQSMIIHCTLE